MITLDPNATALTPSEPTKKKKFDKIFARSNMRTEWLPVKRFAPCAKLLLTPQQTKFRDEDVAAVTEGDTVLILGGYYSADEIARLERKDSVTVTVNKSQHCEFLNPDASKLHPFWEVIDRHNCGDFDDHVLDFMAGINVLFPSPDKFNLNVLTDDVVEACVERGIELRAAARQTVDVRVKNGKYVTIPGSDVKVFASFGDTYIVDSTVGLATASETGLGLLVRFDMSRGKVLYSMYSKRPADSPACEIMEKYYGGGGSARMAGGQADFDLAAALFE